MDHLRYGTPILMGVVATLFAVFYSGISIIIGVFSMMNEDGTFWDGFMVSAIAPLSGTGWHLALWLLCAVITAIIYSMMFRDFFGKKDSVKRSASEIAREKELKRQRRRQRWGMKS